MSGPLMNLAELIKPHTFELSDEIVYTPFEIKQMTTYDVEHLSECKDMLELILRARNNNIGFRKFVKPGDDQDISYLDEYNYLVPRLINVYAKCDLYNPSEPEPDSTINYFAPATGRMADFCDLMPNPKLADRVARVATSRNGEDFYLVIRYQSKMVLLGEISKWQAG